VLFIAMGLAPLVLELRGGPLRSFIGSHNVADERFTDPPTARRTLYAFGPRDPGETVPATGADIGLSLGVLIAAVALGAWLSFTAFHAVAAAG
jgi:hypothetical protein